MHKKKYLEEHTVLKVFAVASLIFLIFSTSFFFVFLDRNFYDKAYSKYGAYNTVGVEGVRQTTDSLIKYLLSENSDPNAVGLQAFIGLEQSHLRDVHGLFRTLKYLSIISLLSSIGLITWLYWKLKKDDFRLNVGRILRMAAYGSAMALLILFLLSFNFTWLFDSFHKLFFPMGNYTFPQTSLLIIMFPEEFFRDFAMKILFHVLVFSAVLFFIGWSKKMLGKK